MTTNAMENALAGAYREGIRRTAGTLHLGAPIGVTCQSWHLEIPGQAESLTPEEFVTAWGPDVTNLAEEAGRTITHFAPLVVEDRPAAQQAADGRKVVRRRERAFIVRIYGW